MKLPHWVLHQPWLSLSIWAVGAGILSVAAAAGDRVQLAVGLGIATASLPIVVFESWLHRLFRAWGWGP